MTNPRSIIFLHGLQATPERSGSARAIRDAFSVRHAVITPDYLPLERSHVQIEKFLGEIICSNPGALLVGTSLGGYWAYRMSCVLSAELGLSCVLLNPYFYHYPEVGYFEHNPEVEVTMLVNLDDELIGPLDLIKRFEGKAQMIISETGGHRFKDKAPIINAVRQALQSSGEE